MTREEAIQVLESMKSEENYNALVDLCNMAIESLQKDIERHERVIRASERHLGIVRCKDCRYYEKFNYEAPSGYNGWCNTPVIYADGHYTNALHFCSYGKRGEE